VSELAGAETALSAVRSLMTEVARTTEKVAEKVGEAIEGSRAAGEARGIESDAQAAHLQLVEATPAMPEARPDGLDDAPTAQLSPDQPWPSTPVGDPDRKGTS
jgi:hypothetical protein